MRSFRSICTVFLAWAITAILIVVLLPAGLFAPFGRYSYFIEHLWAGVICRMMRMRVEVSGLENLEPSHNYIFVCNHQSLMDIPVMMRYTPRQLRFIYKKELNWIPLFGQILVMLKYIAIDRGNRERAARSLEQAAKRIHDGVNVMIFADGTRSLDGKLRPLKRGAFILAIASQVEIVPVAISGTINIVHKFEGLTDLKFGMPVHVAFGKPVRTSSLGPGERDGLKGRVESEIASLFADHQDLSVLRDAELLRKIDRRNRADRNSQPTRSIAGE